MDDSIGDRQNVKVLLDDLGLDCQTDQAAASSLRLLPGRILWLKQHTDLQKYHQYGVSAGIRNHPCLVLSLVRGDDEQVTKCRILTVSKVVAGVAFQLLIRLQITSFSGYSEKKAQARASDKRFCPIHPNDPNTSGIYLKLCGNAQLRRRSWIRCHTHHDVPIFFLENHAEYRGWETFRLTEESFRDISQYVFGEPHPACPPYLETVISGVQSTLISPRSRLEICGNLQSALKDLDTQVPAPAKEERNFLKPSTLPDYSAVTSREVSTQSRSTLGSPVILSLSVNEHISKPDTRSQLDSEPLIMTSNSINAKRNYGTCDTSDRTRYNDNTNGATLSPVHSQYHRTNAGRDEESGMRTATNRQWLVGMLQSLRMYLPQWQQLLTFVAISILLFSLGFVSYELYLLVRLIIHKIVQIYLRIENAVSISAAFLRNICRCIAAGLLKLGGLTVRAKCCIITIWHKVAAVFQKLVHRI